MFDIEYEGGNGLIISTKKTELVVDPNLKVVGLRPLSVKNKVEVATEERFAVSDAEALLNIEGPGEYEIGDFSIRGIPAHRHIDEDRSVEKNTTIYSIEVNDVRLAVIGNIAPQLSEDQLEEIGVIDILILPVGGGGFTLDATSATNMVRSIDPKVVIPVHYADSALSYEVPQDDVSVFIKELTAPVEHVSGKYRIKNALALPQVLTIVQLGRN